jgi:hypothetical protein
MDVEDVEGIDGRATRQFDSQRAEAENLGRSVSCHQEYVMYPAVPNTMGQQAPATKQRALFKGCMCMAMAWSPFAAPCPHLALSYS